MRVIGVADPTRSGKSTLATHLQRHLPDCGLVHQDQFLAGGETPDAVDWRRFELAIRKSMSQHKNTVVEGFLLFSNPALLDLFNVKIFLKINRDECHRRRYATKRTGLAGAAFDRVFDAQIWAAYQKFGDFSCIPGVLILDAHQPSELVFQAAVTALELGTVRLQE